MNTIAGSQKVRLVVWRKTPSLNLLFGMGHWQRKKEKQATQVAFASALKDAGCDSLTLTTFARNTSLIAAATRASSRTTGRKTSNFKSRKRRSARRPMNAP